MFAFQAHSFTGGGGGGAVGSLYSYVGSAARAGSAAQRSRATMSGRMVDSPEAKAGL